MDFTDYVIVLIDMTAYAEKVAWSRHCQEVFGDLWAKEFRAVQVAIIPLNV